eukprot:GHVH01016077.1.p2 GENE.GHVH01016077.1~~GHVH01016077.1.p2  ORF type:complete len:484 (-),score=94.85 GHVH01016077.1:261-1712(-)
MSSSCRVDDRHISRLEQDHILLTDKQKNDNFVDKVSDSFIGWVNGLSRPVEWLNAAPYAEAYGPLNPAHLKCIRLTPTIQQVREAVSMARRGGMQLTIDGMIWEQPFIDCRQALLEPNPYASTVHRLPTPIVEGSTERSVRSLHESAEVRTLFFVLKYEPRPPAFEGGSRTSPSRASKIAPIHSFALFSSSSTVERGGSPAKQTNPSARTDESEEHDIHEGAEGGEGGEEEGEEGGEEGGEEEGEEEGEEDRSMGLVTSEEMEADVESDLVSNDKKTIKRKRTLQGITKRSFSLSPSVHKPSPQRARDPEKLVDIDDDVRYIHWRNHWMQVIIEARRCTFKLENYNHLLRNIARTEERDNDELNQQMIDPPIMPLEPVSSPLPLRFLEKDEPSFQEWRSYFTTALDAFRKEFCLIDHTVGTRVPGDPAGLQRTLKSVDAAAEDLKSGAIGKEGGRLSIRLQHFALCKRATYYIIQDLIASYVT